MAPRRKRRRQHEGRRRFFAPRPERRLLQRIVMRPASRQRRPLYALSDCRARPQTGTQVVSPDSPRPLRTCKGHPPLMHPGVHRGRCPPRPGQHEGRSLRSRAPTLMCVLLPVAVRGAAKPLRPDLSHPTSRAPAFHLYLLEHSGESARGMFHHPRMQDELPVMLARAERVPPSPKLHRLQYAFRDDRRARLRQCVP